MVIDNIHVSDYTDCTLPMILLHILVSKTVLWNQMHKNTNNNQWTSDGECFMKAAFLFELLLLGLRFNMWRMIKYPIRVYNSKSAGCRWLIQSQQTICITSSRTAVWNGICICSECVRSLTQHSYFGLFNIAQNMKDKSLISILYVDIFSWPCISNSIGGKKKCVNVSSICHQILIISR